MVQRELDIKDLGWGVMKGASQAEKLKNLKDDLSAVKKAIGEKLKSEREELAAAKRDTTADTQQAQKKYDEFETKLREKDTRIGQLNNAIKEQMKKQAALNKQIEELKLNNATTSTTVTNEPSDQG